jgi:hypothetical protein
MAGLSINPLSQLVNQVSASIQTASNAAGSALTDATNTINKAQLDAKISQLSGELGSGLNGLSGNLKTAFGSSSLGDFASKASSSVSGAVGSLQSAVGSTSNIAADISGTLNKLTGGNLAGGLQSLAGQISSAAGMLNNILSLRRGANLPGGGESLLKQGQTIKLRPGFKDDWRVRINAPWDLFKSDLFTRLQDTGGVVWPYNPNITVTTKADYTSQALVHSNYNFQSYKNSSIEAITITGEFTSETEVDAAYWIAATTFFKTATKMFFGTGPNAGNPPIVCNLTGYGSSVFDNIPVVVTNFSVDLKDDVNYIQCNTFGTNTWVPIISTITVTVMPVYNRRRLRQFSLEDYARGGVAGRAAGGGIGYI